MISHDETPQTPDNKRINEEEKGMFTRRHYKKVAQIIKGIDPQSNLARNPCRESPLPCPLVERLILLLKIDNPNFDGDKFRKELL